MACTADEDSVGYLNDIDERFRAVPLAIFSFQVFCESQKNMTKITWQLKIHS